MERAGFPKSLTEGRRLCGRNSRGSSRGQACAQRSCSGQGLVFGAGLKLDLVAASPEASTRYPELSHLIYVDDRSWAACKPYINMCESVWNFWKRESLKLGFKENLAKAQFFHVNCRGRRRLRDTSCDVSFER